MNQAQAISYNGQLAYCQCSCPYCHRPYYYQPPWQWWPYSGPFWYSYNGVNANQQMTNAGDIAQMAAVSAQQAQARFQNQYQSNFGQGQFTN